MQYIVDTIFNVVISKSKGRYPAGFEYRFAMGIVLFYLDVFMNSTVDFNGKLRLFTEKIGDKAFDYLLTSELESSALPVAETSPQSCF